MEGEGGCPRERKSLIKKALVLFLCRASYFPWFMNLLFPFSVVGTCIFIDPYPELFLNEKQGTNLGAPLMMRLPVMWLKNSLEASVGGSTNPAMSTMPL
ncbi:hypothetical protein COLO4_36649 [Corchorus olitorius]|uniref:Uncharacterized protein n=1 Tax=Corchorus olitorius TaxID=93759 RepID=A0A1R3G712_9ROSI|nr:hypothetical protein COLO4_36649 [Corchorus olitorius]